MMYATDQPLVSIVTPSFNQGAYLRRTIDSVLGQTYPHIEYIVMDGSSRDASLDILKSYGPRLRWVSEPDRGQTDAINKGFAQTQGEIRAYLNSDDVLLPHAVASVVDHLTRFPDRDMVYGRAFFIDEHDRAIEPYPTEEYSFERLLQICFICQPAAFWRKRIADRIGPLNDRLHFVMDYDYWMRIDRAGGEIAHVPETLAWARVHAKCKTQTCRQAMFQEMFVACVEQAGQVGYSQLLAYWHHLCHGRRHGWPRHLRHLPGFSETMANFHFRWLRNRKAIWPFCTDAGAGMARRLGRLLSRYQHVTRTPLASG